MKYLKTYEAHRYKTLSRREHLDGNVDDLLKKYTTWYDITNSESAIYRGITHNDKRKRNQDAYLISPSAFNRTSVDSMNIHNIIIDNSEYWSEFPKRSESIVCTTNYNDAEMYGEVYRVIPVEENSLFGVANSYDLFHSFQNLKEIDDNIDDLRELERYIENTFDTIDTIGKNPKTMEDLEKLMSIDNLDYDIRVGEEYTLTGYTKEDMEKIFKQYGSFVNYLEQYMKPADNGFTLIEYNQEGFGIGFESRELWTDVKCLLIKESYIRRNY